MTIEELLSAWKTGEAKLLLSCTWERKYEWFGMTIWTIWSFSEHRWIINEGLTNKALSGQL